MLACRLCPAATHLILTSFVLPGGGGQMFQQSIYKGPQLVASVMHSDDYRLVAASAEASVLQFVYAPRAGQMTAAASALLRVMARS